MASTTESSIHGTPYALPRHGQSLRRVHGKIAHRTRGRLRLQFAGASLAELQQIEAGVHTLPGVGNTEVRPRTGSVIVHHAANHGELVAHLADLARHSSLFYLEAIDDPSKGSAQLTDVEHDAAYLVDHSKAGKAIVRYAEHLNRAVKQVTNGWVDLRVLLPATAGICALIFVEIESAPLWVPLALFSFQSFNNLHQPHVTTEGEIAKPQPLLTAGSPAEDLPKTEEPTSVPAKAVQRAKKGTTRTADVNAESKEA